MIKYEYFDRAVKGKKIILFGAGSACAKALILRLANYEIEYVCDNDSRKWGSYFMGLAVCSPEKLYVEPRENIIVLITSMFHNEIALQLLKENIPYVKQDIFQQTIRLSLIRQTLVQRREAIKSHETEILKVYNLLSDKKSVDIYNTILANYRNANMCFRDICEGNHYFNDIFSNSIQENEIYVDVGVCNGETILSFIQYVNNQYAKIYGFEADPINYWKTKIKFFNASKKIDFINCACSNYNENVMFNITGGGSSAVSNTTGYLIKAVALDDFIQDKVTFIKMDIEGAEYNALLGARRIIETHKPKLAIALYHEHDDIWRLPLLIHELVPEYKFHIRHHSPEYIDTVLYAKI